MCMCEFKKKKKEYRRLCARERERKDVNVDTCVLVEQLYVTFIFIYITSFCCLSLKYTDELMYIIYLLMWAYH